jgi:phosphate transport system protein
MRNGYHKQLEELHTELIRMGSLCEEAIDSAVRGLLEDRRDLRERAVRLEKENDFQERKIETLCVGLLLREQPVAGDLRRIFAAQGMITDMERVGDQAQDIAELGDLICGTREGGVIQGAFHIGDMAKAAAGMLTASVDSYVQGDLEKAKAVIRSDDEVDKLFLQVKGELIALISGDSQRGAACLDLLMIAKYLERIGDHAVNIAEWVVYSITGSRKPDT